MGEPKTIYCPICKRKIATYDGRTTIDISVNCKKCKKRIVYRIDSGETEIKRIQKRTTSSGMTFG